MQRDKINASPLFTGYDPKGDPCEENPTCEIAYLSEAGYEKMFMETNGLSGKISSYDFYANLEGVDSEFIASGNSIFKADIDGIARGMKAKKNSRIGLEIGMSFDGGESGRPATGTNITMTEWLTGSPFVQSSRTKAASYNGCSIVSCNVSQGSGNRVYASYGDQWMYQNSLDGDINRQRAGFALRLYGYAQGGPLAFATSMYDIGAGLYDTAAGRSLEQQLLGAGGASISTVSMATKASPAFNVGTTIYTKVVEELFND